MTKIVEKSYLLGLPESMHTQVKTVSSQINSNMKQFILESISEKLERERERLKGGAIYGQEKG